MLIIPYVCAEFRDRTGNVLYQITPDMLRSIQDAPESIKQDLLFDMLVKDGSIKTPETTAQKKLLEQDPMIGMNADGRSAEAAEKQEKAEKAEKPARAAKAEKTEQKEPVQGNEKTEAKPSAK